MTIEKAENNGSINSFPTKSRKDFTGYKALRATPEGRRQLKSKGYTVRSQHAKPGAASTAKRTEHKRLNSKFVTSNFIAWDGEGVNFAGKHHYVLLMCSTGDYLVTDSSVRPEGLPTDICLQFLLEIAAKYPNSHHVIYGGGYDFNKILKDLITSPLRLEKLYKTGKTFWKSYHIEWIRGKWLRVKDMRSGLTVKIYDVLPFFQMSFVKTLEKWGVTVEGQTEIETMKDLRGSFNWAEHEARITHYCDLELRALVQLMEKFRTCHLEANLPYLTGWYGPGSIANGLLRRHTIKRHMLETIRTVNDAALYAFAAGRIERLLYGNYEGPISVLDIHSAYPYSISRLPSLKGGWKRVKSRKDYPIQPMSLYHVRMYAHNDYASPLFFRKHNGAMFFPNPKEDNYIENWIWTPEYEQLVKWNIPHQVVEMFYFLGDVESRPFAWMEEMYYQRRKWVEEGNPAEKNLKLALNSIYGKMVQQAGFETFGRIPPFHQIEWGGYVTSSTRAQLYDAMRKINFRGVIGVETDSLIIAGNKIPDVPISDDLGDWELKQHDGITYIQSGVYWVKQGTEWLDKYSKARGYRPKTLTRDMVLEAWKLNPIGDLSLFDEDNRAIGMCVYAEGNDFITIGHCYRPGASFDDWGDWIVGPKKLSLWKTTKREIVRSHSPAKGLLKTYDHTDFSGWSTPYDLIWGNDGQSEPT